MTSHSAQRTTSLKRASALIGGSAVVAMAALAMTIGQDPGPAAVATPKMVFGATSTQTTPSSTPAIKKATPAIKGVAPLPSEEARVV